MSSSKNSEITFQTLKKRNDKIKNALFKVVYDAYDYNARIEKFHEKLREKGNKELLIELEEIRHDYAEKMEKTGKLLTEII